MYQKYMKVASIFLLVLLILCAFAAANFFTKDNVNKGTIEKVTIAHMRGERMYKREELTEQQETEENLTVSVDKIDTNVSNKNTVSTEKKLENEQTKKEENIVSTTNTVKTSNSTVNTVEKETATSNIVSQYKGFSTVGKIEIPKTGLSIPILSNVTVKGMEVAPCLLYSTGELNQKGNNLIVGHNYRNGKIFSNNKNLQIGDKIYITALDGNKVEYTIYSKFIATPEETSYLKRDTSGGPEISLSTCTDDENARLVILAK